jgi:CRP-like cAMP-binding protein
MSAAAKKTEWSVEDFVALYKSISLFEGFSPQIIDDLAGVSELLEIAPHAEILKQGQSNEYLHFLVDGTVGVYVDGGRVSRLSTKGDLLGEMSLISIKKVSATIVAETPVTLARVNTRIFFDNSGPNRDHYHATLYRIYATVLSEKLSMTNQRAKKFEELNANLTAAHAELEAANQNLEKKVEERTQKLEQQNAELSAGKSKLEDVMNSRRILFGKLYEFHTQHLLPLKGLLDDLHRNDLQNTVIQDARTMAFDVQELLGPLTIQYSSEQAMKSKRVLLADSNKKQQIVAKMALGGSGVELDYVSNPEEGAAKIASKDYDLLFVDSEMVELANLFKTKNPQAGLVLMTSTQIPTYLPALKKMDSIPHIVSRDETDRVFSVKNIMTTATKLLSRDLFGLEKYLSWGVELHAKTIFASDQRAQLIQDVDQYFERLGIRRANRDRIRLVTEEMLMNAIYDAPAGADGKALYNHLPRSVDVKLKAEEQGQLRFATDGMFVAVSVQDPFGSLNSHTILRYLEHNYAGTANDLNEKEKKGGAGLGLHQIVENADLVVFNIDPGKKTEVIALFNVEVKEAINKNPSFHLFVK